MHNFEKIFDIKNHSEFKKQCLDIYNFQYENNMVYQNYCNMICEDPTDVNEINKIPFLPISFFKTKKILSTCLYSFFYFFFKCSGLYMPSTTSTKVTIERRINTPIIF